MFEVSQVQSHWKGSLPWDRTAELRRQDMDDHVDVQKRALAHTLVGQKQVSLPRNVQNVYCVCKLLSY